MHDPAIMIRGFARPNIKLAVHSYFTDEAHKLRSSADDVMSAAGKEGPRIVYGARTNAWRRWRSTWSSRGLRAAAYHAGLPARRRLEVEDRFGTVISTSSSPPSPSGWGWTNPHPVGVPR